MPKIKWCGNKLWNTDYPEGPLPNKAKEIKRPEDIFKACLPYGIIPLLFSYGIIVLKWFVIDEKIVNPLFVPLGVLLGISLIPVHEILHAICFARGQTVYCGISLEKLAAFAVCHEPISRSRYIAMSLLPMLLGIIPLAVFLFVPANAVISSLCIPSGIIGMLSPMPDYMDVHMILKQTPKAAFIQTQNDGLYWYK